MFSIFIIIIFLLFVFEVVDVNACYRKGNENAVVIPDSFIYIDEINPNIIVNLRYYKQINFVGEIIDGYKANRGILTKKAADALNNAWKQFDRDGYNIVIYDMYRPQKAVDNFVRWADNTNYDINMKKLFFPYVDHDKCFELGYIAKKSGHSRGSTIDFTIFPKDKKLQEINLTPRSFSDGRNYMFLDDGTLDMGSSFDLFDEASWTNSTLVNPTAQANRQYLKNIMSEAGFKNYPLEWWHYTLIDEPFPDTYFNFNIE